MAGTRNGAGGLSVRLNLPGLPAEATLEQIARFGEEALPALRSGVPGPSPTASARAG